MAHSLSLNLLILLFLNISSLLSTALAAGPPVGNRPPELPYDPPPEIIHAPPNPASPAGSPQKSPPPFSELESIEHLKELADKVKELMDSLISLFPATTTLSSAPAPLTAAATTMSNTNSNAAASSLTARPSSSTGKPNATLACEVYQAYTSLCPPVTTSGYTYFVGKPYTVDAADASASARASCLCYSSAYYVPDVYDDAMWACAGYTTDTTNSVTLNVTLAAAATAAATAFAAQTDRLGFCESVGNVRPDASSASFGQFTATSTTTATSTATVTGGGSTGAVGKLLSAERGMWARAAAVAAVAALS